jgi:hypothetical protein
MKLNTPKQLAQLMAKKVKNLEQGTFSTNTGLAAKTGYWAVGGMVRPYGQENALYLSTHCDVDVVALESILEANWATVKIVGHFGIWVTDDGDGPSAFIDSVYKIDCLHDSLAGHSDASSHMAMALGIQNEQDAVAHVCPDVQDGVLCHYL